MQWVTFLLFIDIVVTMRWIWSPSAWLVIDLPIIAFYILYPWDIYTELIFIKHSWIEDLLFPSNEGSLSSFIFRVVFSILYFTSTPSKIFARISKIDFFWQFMVLVLCVSPFPHIHGHSCHFPSFWLAFATNCYR